MFVRNIVICPIIYLYYVHIIDYNLYFHFCHLTWRSISRWLKSFWLGSTIDVQIQPFPATDRKCRWQTHHVYFTCGSLEILILRTRTDLEEFARLQFCVRLKCAAWFKWIQFIRLNLSWHNLSIRFWCWE